MPESRRYEYLVSGRNSHGRRWTEIVLAGNADEALRLFEDHGYSDVVLHTDDVAAPLFKPSAMRKHFRPSECVRLRTAGPVQFAVLLTLSLYRQMWHACILGVGLFVCLLFADLEFTAWGFLAAFSFLMPVGLGAYWSVTSPFRRDRRILKAVAWARWEELLQLVRDHPNKKGDKYTLHFRKAQALAGLGFLTEGLAEFDRVFDTPELPEFIYWVGQAAIYMAAREPQKMTSVLDRAHELAPSATLVQIDYANKLLVYCNDVRQARAVLAEARRHAIADSTIPWLNATEGLLALKERRPADAVELLTQAIRGMRPFFRGNPSILPLGSRIDAWLCLAHAELGDTINARRHLRRAMPLLAAHREDELLQKCEHAAG